jgi:hypothetical protein
VLAKWERKCESSDNREVGLEAAILERVRNSSPVEFSRADNVAGLKPAAEIADHGLFGGVVVGERSAGAKVVREDCWTAPK